MTAPEGELDYTSPNGIPDRSLPEREARLWWLSEAERKRGSQVVWNGDVLRWQRQMDMPLPEEVRRCADCAKQFIPARAKAIHCSVICRQRAARKAKR